MKKAIVFLCSVLITVTSFAQNFQIIPLGVHGGLEENNLSAYLIGMKGNPEYIAMDAGTLNAGLQKCSHKYFHKSPMETMQQNIVAYFISHPHLDHLAGLIQNAPSDSKKSIYGLDFTIDAISKHYFSWDTWANFGDKGESPQLKKYHLETMTPKVPIEEPKTGFYITAFPLSHATPGKSSAFLIQNKEKESLLYLGDTGADTIEHSHALKDLWEAVAPLIRNHSLKAIMIEVSYPNSQPDKSLFGHLTPRLLNQELSILSDMAGAENIKNLPIIITHIKPDGNNGSIIKNEIKKNNPLQVKWIFPKQGKKIVL